MNRLSNLPDNVTERDIARAAPYYDDGEAHCRECGRIEEIVNLADCEDCDREDLCDMCFPSHQCRPLVSGGKRVIHAAACVLAAAMCIGGAFFWALLGAW